MILTVNHICMTELKVQGQAKPYGKGVLYGAIVNSIHSNTNGAAHYATLYITHFDSIHMFSTRGRYYLPYSINDTCLISHTEPYVTPKIATCPCCWYT